MILYCDTSALLKLYIAEIHSDVLHGLVADAEAVAVSRIAWAEAHAALARRGREMPADSPVIAAARRALADDWPHFLVAEVTQAVMMKAGEYADTFALRGYDSVQLATAHEVMMQGAAPVSFACCDSRLNKAARILGMTVPLIEAG